MTIFPPVSIPRRFSLICALLLAAGTASAQHAPQPKTPAQQQSTGFFSWNQSVDGDWFDEFNWANTVSESLLGLPQSQDNHALLGGVGSYAVDVNRLLRIGSVNIRNPLAEMHVYGPVNWYMHGDLVNDGTIRLNFKGSPENVILRAGEPFRVDGQGVIELNAQTSPYDAQLLSLEHQITIGPGQTIRGTGAVRGNIRNEGLILADAPSVHGMVLGFDITQGTTGQILIEQSTLRLDPSATLTGGHLGMGDGSTLELLAGTRVEVDSMSFGEDTALLIDGDVEFPMPASTPSILSLGRNSTVFTLEDDYVNDGKIVVGSGDGPFWATLRIGAACSIRGVGEIVLVPGLNELIVEDQHTMSIGPGQSIIGGGEISTPNGGRVFNQSAIISTDGMKCRAKIVGGQLIADGGIMYLNDAEIFNAELVVELGGSFSFDRTRLVDTRWNHDLIPSGRLTLGGTCTSNGTIELTNASVFCDFNTTLLGEGSIQMNGAGISEGSLTLPSTQSIYGGGIITTSITSNSQIWVSEEEELWVAGETNYGGDYIADGGTMRISGEFVESQFIVGDGALLLWNVELNNCSIVDDSGGSLRLAAGGDLVLDSMRYDGNLDIRADVDQRNESEVYLRGDTELNGNHYIFDEGKLVFDSTELSGDSVFTMAWSTLGSRFRPLVYAVDGSGISEGYLLQGAGDVEGEDGAMGFVNSGQLIANDPFSQLRLSGTFSGDGLFLADDNEIQLYNGAVLKGVTLDAEGSGFYSMSGQNVEFDGVTNRSLIIVGHEDAALTVQNGFANNEVVSIRASQETGIATMFMEQAQVSGSGVIELMPTDNAFESRLLAIGNSIIGPDQMIRGEGLVRGEGEAEFRGRFNLQGTMDPGGVSRTLRLDDVRMDPEARIIIDIDGTDAGQFDVLEIINQGRITLGGTLEVRFGDSFAASFGDAWTIVRGGAFLGAFEELVTNVPLPTGLDLRVIELDGELQLVATCAGDYNTDFAIDFSDVSNFLSDFNNQEPEADITGDGIFDFFDVSAILDRISAGCGSE